MRAVALQALKGAGSVRSASIALIKNSLGFENVLVSAFTALVEANDRVGQAGLRGQ
jgi:hypothetical protein